MASGFHCSDNLTILIWVKAGGAKSGKSHVFYAERNMNIMFIQLVFLLLLAPIYFFAVHGMVDSLLHLHETFLRIIKNFEILACIHDK